MKKSQKLIAGCLKLAVARAEASIAEMRKAEECLEKDGGIPTAPKPPKAPKIAKEEIKKDALAPNDPKRTADLPSLGGFKSLASSPTGLPKLPGLGRKASSPAPSNDMTGFKSLASSPTAMPKLPGLGRMMAKAEKDAAPGKKTHTWGKDGFCIHCPKVHQTDNNARSTASGVFSCKGTAAKPESKAVVEKQEVTPPTQGLMTSNHSRSLLS